MGRAPRRSPAPQTYLEREQARYVRGSITIEQLEQSAEVLLRAGAADRVPCPFVSGRSTPPRPEPFPVEAVVR